MDSEKNRKYAAHLARQFYSSKRNIRLFEDDFPYDDNDKELIELFKLVKQTPRKRKLFKFNHEKYKNHVLKVYELIEKLEKDN